MSNMSHCRFYNTLSDLRDCYEHMDEELMAVAEHESRLRLIRLCVKIASDYGDELETYAPRA